MKQAPVVDGLSLDALSFFEDGLASAKVDVGWGQIIDALVIALGVVVLDEAIDLGLQGTRQIIVFQQNAVLQGLMPPLDLTLGLRVVGGAADMGDLLVVQPFGQIARDVAGTVVRQQARLVPNVGLMADPPALQARQSDTGL